jgi:hypothetical protein
MTAWYRSSLKPSPEPKMMLSLMVACSSPAYWSERLECEMLTSLAGILGAVSYLVLPLIYEHAARHTVHL